MTKHLRFADDLVLLEENPKKLKKMIQIVTTESSKVRLKIYIIKMKLTTNSNMETIEIREQQ